MARVNSLHEQIELENLKPKIKKAKLEQNKYEKGKIYVPVLNSFGNQRVLTKPCPGCNSVKVLKINNYFHCQKCNTNYFYDRMVGAVKLNENEKLEHKKI